jgi:hypothetical protein
VVGTAAEQVTTKNRKIWAVVAAAAVTLTLVVLLMGLLPTEPVLHRVDQKIQIVKVLELADLKVRKAPMEG